MAKAKETKIDRARRITMGLIQLRRTSIAREFDEALKSKEWSKLSGLDGIDVGLMIAEKIVKENVK